MIEFQDTFAASTVALLTYSTTDVSLATHLTERIVFIIIDQGRFGVIYSAKFKLVIHNSNYLATSSYPPHTQYRPKIQHSFVFEH